METKSTQKEKEITATQEARVLSPDEHAATVDDHNSCGTCRYWFRKSCRHQPPSTEGWATTDPDDWCGRWSDGSAGLPGRAKRMTDERLLTALKAVDVGVNFGMPRGLTIRRLMDNGIGITRTAIIYRLERLRKAGLIGIGQDPNDPDEKATAIWLVGEGKADENEPQVMDVLRAASGPLSGREIARKAGLSSSAGGRKLAELVKAGLVRQQDGGYAEVLPGLEVRT